MSQEDTLEKYRTNPVLFNSRYQAQGKYPAIYQKSVLTIVKTLSYYFIFLHFFITLPINTPTTNK